MPFFSIIPFSSTRINPPTCLRKLWFAFSLFLQPHSPLLHSLPIREYRHIYGNSFISSHVYNILSYVQCPFIPNSLTTCAFRMHLHSLLTGLANFSSSFMTWHTHVPPGNHTWNTPFGLSNSSSQVLLSIILCLEHVHWF